MAWPNGLKWYKLPNFDNWRIYQFKVMLPGSYFHTCLVNEITARVIFPASTMSLCAQWCQVCVLFTSNFCICSSQPSMVHWLSSSIFPCLVVRLFGWLSCHGNTRRNLTSRCPIPPNPYIFWKLMIIAIQKWIRNRNTKTNTNTKTVTKTKTPRG